MHNVAQVERIVRTADTRRAESSTLMNSHSSRSHAILTFYITHQKAKTALVVEDANTDSKDVTNLPPRVFSGKLHILDLAGSERLKKSGAENVQADEGRGQM